MESPCFPRQDLAQNQLVDVSIELLSDGLCRCACLEEVLFFRRFLRNNEALTNLEILRPEVQMSLCNLFQSIL